MLKHSKRILALLGATTAVACVFVLSPPSAEGATLIGQWELNEGGGTVAHDTSGFDRHATIYTDAGNPTWTSEGLRFDSPDDNTGRGEVTFPNLPGSFSVETRFMPTDRGFVVAKWGPYEHHCGWSFGLNAQKQLHFWLATPVVPVDTGVIYETPLEMGRWYTALGIFESGVKSELYVDGKLVGVTPTTCLQHRQTDNQPLYLGNFHWGDPPSDWNPFRGEIDYVRIYEGVALVPEPSTVALLTFGSVCLLAYAWRRRKLAA